MADLGVIRLLAGKALRLPARSTRRVDSELSISVPMRDGTVLLADRYSPAGQLRGPVVLIRTPYGRSAVFATMAGLFAERGLQVVLQSVRGTSGSGGQFDPMRQELTDGADTVDWVRARPWFGDQLFAFGPSYLGNVQWAMANERGNALDGLALLVTLSNFENELRSFGGFTLGGALGWSQMMMSMIEAAPGKRPGRPKPDALRRFFGHLPVGTIDHVALGKAVPWWQDWVSHDDPDDPWWDVMDHSKAVATLEAPTSMIGGWQDIFLPFQIRDFETRQTAGKDAWLTVGPWTHAAPGGMAEGLRQAISSFSDLAAGRRPHGGRDRVRLFVQGLGEWREYSSWPPAEAEPLRLHLHASGALDTAAPVADGASRYVYDPGDPTPSVHGPKVTGGKKRRDMSQLERRHDTVVFTTAALEHDRDVIGPVTVELVIRSDREHTDFYACLCDVDAQGRSLQVCDGYLRLRPGRPAADESGIRRVTLNCWPTAHRFKRGHRLRLVVASGAHPRYARNLGTGEPLATGTNIVPAHQEILHGADVGSSLNLLVVSGS